jgi:hypothetical protein
VSHHAFAESLLPGRVPQLQPEAPFTWTRVGGDLFLINFFFEESIFLNRTQWQCTLSFDNSTAVYTYKGLNTLHPGGIRTRAILFYRRTRWPLCHAARASKRRL